METKAFGIPKQDLKKFFALPQKCQREVELWMLSVAILEEEKPLAPAIRKFCISRRLKPSVVSRKLALYRRKGWLGLIDRVKYPKKPAAASNEDFRNFIFCLWTGNGKNYGKAHAQLIAIWKQKAPIPGYNQNPTKSSWNDCPDGWTYCNFICQIKAHIKRHPELKHLKIIPEA